MDLILNLPVERLMAICNPILTPPWPNSESLAIANIENELRLKKFNFDVHDPESPLQKWGLKEHSQRIAYFAAMGWNTPIVLDVGIPSMGLYVNWPIIDGNHRFAAAIIRQDTTIQSNISGCISHINELFYEQ